MSVPPRTNEHAAASNSGRRPPAERGPTQAAVVGLRALSRNPVRAACARRTDDLSDLSRVLTDPPRLLSNRLPLRLLPLPRRRQLQGTADERSRLPRSEQVPARRCTDQQPPLGD